MKKLAVEVWTVDDNGAKEERVAVLVSPSLTELADVYTRVVVFKVAAGKMSSKVCKLLGIGRSTLYRRLAKWRADLPTS